MGHDSVQEYMRRSAECHALCHALCLNGVYLLPAHDGGSWLGGWIFTDQQFISLHLASYDHLTAPPHEPGPCALLDFQQRCCRI